MSLDTDSKMDNSCNNTLEIKTNSTTPAESANLSLDTLDADTIINLISKQGEKFEVSKKCAFISNLVKTICLNKLHYACYSKRISLCSN